MQTESKQCRLCTQKIKTVVMWKLTIINHTRTAYEFIMIDKN